MANIRRSDSSTPPFGAEVFNGDGVSVAMVLDDGQAWLAGVNPDETLKVVWNGKTQCKVTIPAKASNYSNSVLLPCH